MAGLSTKIKGLRFMQRAIDKAARDVDDERDKADKSGTVDGLDGTDGVNSEARDDRGGGTRSGWIAEAATSRCVVLRGDHATPPSSSSSSSRPKGRLSFGKTLVDVESEQVRIVTEQMQSPEETDERKGAREQGRLPVVKKRGGAGAGNKTSTTKKKKRRA